MQVQHLLLPGPAAMLLLVRLQAAGWAVLAADHLLSCPEAAAVVQHHLACWLEPLGLHAAWLAKAAAAEKGHML